jgi:putative SOS response-associated peptidase YedK
MCGRYTLTKEFSEFARKLPLEYDRTKFNPRHNITPTSIVNIVPNDGSNTIIKAKWGSVPASKMQKYAVSNLVSKPVNDRPEVIRPRGEDGCS